MGKKMDIKTAIDFALTGRLVDLDSMEIFDSYGIPFTMTMSQSGADAIMISFEIAKDVYDGKENGYTYKDGEYCDIKAFVDKYFVGYTCHDGEENKYFNCVVCEEQKENTKMLTIRKMIERFQNNMWDVDVSYYN